MAPAALARRPTEHLGISTAATAGISRREGNQQITTDGVDFGVFRTGGRRRPDGAGRQVGIHQNRPLQRIPIAPIKAGKGWITLAVGLNGRIVAEQLGNGLLAIAVGKLHGAGEVRLIKPAGQEWIHRGVWAQRQPIARAIGLEAGHLQLTVLQKTGIGLVLHIRDRRAADEAVEMATASVAAGIHEQGLARFRTHRHRLMAKPSQRRVLDRLLIGGVRIDFHHPAVLVARQSVDIAQPRQLALAAQEGTLPGGDRTAISEHGLRHLGLEVFLGAEHRAPGGGATATVGEGSDHGAAQTVVVALTAGRLEHLAGRPCRAQPFSGILKACDSIDAPVLGAASTHPVALAIAFQGHHTNPEIGHRLISDGTDLSQTRVRGGQSCAIDHAIHWRQGPHQSCVRERLTHHLLKAIHPGLRADVLEVHSHRCPVRIVLHKAEVIVVEPETTAAQGIPPCREEIGTEPLRHDKPVLNSHLAVGGPLLGCRQAITVHRQGNAHRLKGESAAVWRSSGRAGGRATPGLGRKQTHASKAEHGQNRAAAQRHRISQGRRQCGAEPSLRSSLTEVG